MVFKFNPIAHQGDRLTDDGFYNFCQANPSLRIEREADGQIVFQMPSNTKTGLQNADLIIEVGLWNRQTKLGLVADSSAGCTLPAKMEKYGRNVVRLGCAIDPFQNQTIIYRPDHEPETVAFTTELSGETVLSGFTRLLSDLLQ